VRLAATDVSGRRSARSCSTRDTSSSSRRRRPRCRAGLSRAAAAAPSGP